MHSPYVQAPASDHAILLGVYLLHAGLHSHRRIHAKGVCDMCRGARRQMKQDGSRHVQASMKKVVDSIMRLSMHLDMLVLQINHYQG